MKEDKLWIEDLYFSRKQRTEVKTSSWWICFYKHTAFHFIALIYRLERCGLHVDYCDVFISCLVSHSDGTHSLQSIHCWASDRMLHSPNLMKKQTHLRVAWDSSLIYLRVRKLSDNLNCCINYTFNSIISVILAINKHHTCKLMETKMMRTSWLTYLCNSIERVRAWRAQNVFLTYWNREIPLHLLLWTA